MIMKQFKNPYTLSKRAHNDVGGDDGLKWLLKGNIAQATLQKNTLWIERNNNITLNIFRIIEDYSKNSKELGIELRSYI